MITTETSSKLHFRGEGIIERIQPLKFTATHERVLRFAVRCIDDETVTIISCSVFGDHGELLSKELRRGNIVRVAGRKLSSKAWTDRDGIARAILNLTPDMIEPV